MALFPTKPGGARRAFIAHRVDKNQPQIVKAFRQMGCTVQHLHMVGKGCPDILVGYGGKNYLFEIKKAAKRKTTDPSKKLTPDERIWHTVWRGQVGIITTPDEVFAFVRGLSQDTSN